MCGFSGAVGTVDDRLVQAVKAMADAMEHRGPDDAGLWNTPPDGPGNGVVLAHRRLSIIDLSEAGHQPMRDPESGCVIAYNGEVYNFSAIRRELTEQGCRFRSNTDTEVILRAYAVWGAEFLGRLRGMFALAIWDPRDQTVLLARDRLGIKPLYLTGGQDGEPLAFASELRSLMAAGVAPRRIDPVALRSYVWNGFVVGPHTMLEGVTLLPAGTWLRVDVRSGTRSEPRPFWSLPGHVEAVDQGAALARAREALSESVGMRLVGDVPLGIFLSGGIDSSAVAALATQHAAGQVRTFNISFDEAKFDESPHARAVADALGTEHNEIRLTEAAFRDGLSDALDSLDQPTFDAVNTYFVSRAVREAGLTVALAGTGGDELFGGYTSFSDLPRAARVARALKAAPTRLIDPLAAAAVRLKSGPPAGPVAPQTRWGKLADVLGTRGDRLGLYQVSYALFTRDFAEKLTEVRAATHYGLPQARAESLAAALQALPDLEAVTHMELTCFIGERLLRDTDCASMAVSLEVRVPLLDHVVLEALSAVESSRRYQPLGRKMLLRELALDRLDPGLFDRPKAGFELPLEVWCKRSLRDEVESTLMDAGACRDVGLVPQAVADLWRTFQAGGTGIYWSRIWALFTLLRWTRQHGVALS